MKRIKWFIINVLATLLEPIYDRIVERKNQASTEETNKAVTDIVKKSTDAANKQKAEVDKYKNDRRNKGLTQDLTNMVKWEVTRQEIQKTKKPQVRKVHRATVLASGRPNR